MRPFLRPRGEHHVAYLSQLPASLERSRQRGRHDKSMTSVSECVFGSGAHPHRHGYPEDFDPVKLRRAAVRNDGIPCNREDYWPGESAALARARRVNVQRKR